MMSKRVPPDPETVDLNLVTTDDVRPLKMPWPSLRTLNRLDPPTCKSIRSEPAAEAVSVTFIFMALNVVPPAFQVSVKSYKYAFAIA
jgi:hypothetical protein